MITSKRNNFPEEANIAILEAAQELLKYNCSQIVLVEEDDMCGVEAATFLDELKFITDRMGVDIELGATFFDEGSQSYVYEVRNYHIK